MVSKSFALRFIYDPLVENTCKCMVQSSCATESKLKDRVLTDCDSEQSTVVA